MNLFNVGIDVGGTHVSCALVNRDTGKLLPESLQVADIDSNGSATQILDVLAGILAKLPTASGNIAGIGIAMPGPFDYIRGISKITGVNKFDRIFGLHLRQFIRGHIPVEYPITFINDASAYACGEYVAGAAKGSTRSIVLTFGTGFGSTFLLDGEILPGGAEGVPEGGFLYNIPYGDSIADDSFATRWFVGEWQKRTGHSISDVKEIADLARTGNQTASDIFNRFADNLAEFIAPWIERFRPDRIVLGGNISKAADLFFDRLVWGIGSNPLFRVSELWDEAPIIGAALSVPAEPNNDTPLRKTEQYLAPAKTAPTPEGVYDIYPGFPIGSGQIMPGAEALADWLAEYPRVVIEGYTGVFWDKLIASIDRQLRKQNKRVRWFHVDAALLPEADIKHLIQPSLGDPDDIFGKITDKKLSDWFDSEKLRQLQPDPGADINILVGAGSSLAGWDAPLVYVDVPKNELQFRMRAHAVTNLGMETYADDRQMYKQSYFVDWRVLNQHKCGLLPRIDLIVDEQRPDAYLSMSGENLRRGLAAMGRNFFRVRPWFEPGAWGGQWMKAHFTGLNTEVTNLAWSFELMVLENGLMFESDGYRLEVSFDFLMYQSHREVLGDGAARFGYEFPIRFDFLDTFDGGNLSVQCHPRPDYIKEQFGMPFTQDETYYILDCEEDADVYLGFQEGVDAADFHHQLIRSQTENVALDVARYVQKFKAEKHALYLIPNGTIHASGKNNLVLEISSAPYIFTFKMYDWLRLDLDGRPRPINIEHGMRNVYFDRQGDRIQREFISKPYVLAETDGYVLEHLPTHPDHFYDIHRYSFHEQIAVETTNKCHVWMLVEGKSVWVETEDGMKQRFNFAETFVIPAAAKAYTITNESNGRVLMVKAFLKD
ncbi:ROK family protein [Parapedobacter defluvii]|uniref:ROK family protein n=1 Tax=Parapedobacter defluvii TaxID=2045106 RepID=UPI00333E9443